MKVSEFRKLIREEVRKVLAEASTMVPNVGFQFSDIGENPKQAFAKNFSMFAKIQNVNAVDSETIKGTVNLNVDILTNLLKANKGYTTLETNTDNIPSLEIYNEKNDQFLTLYKSKIPKNIVSQLTSIKQTKPINKKNPVEKYVDDIVDIAASGQGDASGLTYPSLVKDIKNMVKELKAKNLLAQVSKELVKAINDTEGWTTEDILILSDLGFNMKGANPSEDDYYDDDY